MELILFWRNIHIILIWQIAMHSWFLERILWLIEYFQNDQRMPSDAIRKILVLSDLSDNDKLTISLKRSRNTYKCKMLKNVKAHFRTLNREKLQLISKWAGSCRIKWVLGSINPNTNTEVVHEWLQIIINETTARLVSQGDEKGGC